VTADAAHVAAVAEATCDGSHWWEQPCRMCVQNATVAVETLTPLIRAQIAAEVEAFRRERTPGPEAQAWLIRVRDRITGEERAVHGRTGPGRCACGYDAYKVGGFFPDYHRMLMDHLSRAARAEATR
jgi:hypothetical protein